MADAKLSALASAALTELDEIYVNDGGTSKKATIAELRQHIINKSYLPLDITSLREIGVDTADDIGDALSVATEGSGGILAFDTTPSLKRVNAATDKALVVNWVLGNVDEVQFPPLFMPPDVDAATDLTIHLLAKMSGATDTPTINVEVFDGIGDTEMGGNTAALSNTLAELIVTIANADVAGHPTGFLNVSLIPAAHGTDALELYAAWMEYTRISA